MKKHIILVVLVVVLVPSIAFASWWNPLSWFNNWTFKKAVSQPQMVNVEVQLPTYSPPETEIFVNNIIPAEDNLEKVTSSSVNLPAVEKTKTIVDVCLNVDGIQAITPQGFTSQNNLCTAIQIVVPPNDVCENIEGIQTSVPSGMVEEDKECSTPIANTQNLNTQSNYIAPPAIEEITVNVEVTVPGNNEADVNPSFNITGNFTSGIMSIYKVGDTQDLLYQSIQKGVREFSAWSPDTDYKWELTVKKGDQEKTISGFFKTGLQRIVFYPADDNDNGYDIMTYLKKGQATPSIAVKLKATTDGPKNIVFSENQEKSINNGDIVEISVFGDIPWKEVGGDWDVPVSGLTLEIIEATAVGNDGEEINVVF